MRHADPTSRSGHPDQEPRTAGELAGGGDDLNDVLVQVAFRTMAVLNRVGAEHDLSLTQLRVLGILQDRRLRMTQLADYLGLDKSTMTGLVDRARKRGLLERARNPADGRSAEVFLTGAGAELAAELRTRVSRSLSPMTDPLAPGDQARLQVLLARMLDGRAPAS